MTARGCQLSIVYNYTPSRPICNSLLTLKCHCEADVLIRRSNPGPVNRAGCFVAKYAPRRDILETHSISTAGRHPQPDGLII
jgi:hypothetical protein